MTQRAAKRRVGFQKAFFGMIQLPFIGKVLGLFLVITPWAIPALVYFNDPFSPEAEASGTILGFSNTSRLAREVPYEYVVDGKRQEGKMQWVDLKARPEIKPGAHIRIFYHPANPGFSREAESPTLASALWFTCVMTVVAWLALLYRAQQTDPDPISEARKERTLE